MSNKIKQAMSKIDIPDDLSKRSKIGVSQAKKDTTYTSKKNYMKGIGIVAALIISIGGYAIFDADFSSNNEDIIVMMKNGSVIIPTIQLPKENIQADMIGLIVYNGKIYTQTKTEIAGENAKAIIGEKLGTTKGTIDEWSKQEAYDEELASTTGISTVYAVRGYDKDFRIMTYDEIDGKPYAEFYENLNGITITNGHDVFGKLNIIDNVSLANYRTFNDWNNSIDNYRSIADMTVLNDFVEELNKSKPFPRENDSDPISHSQNNEEFRELTIHLKDGTKVSLTLLKENAIYYGYMAAYFKMDDAVFREMWGMLQ